MVEAFALSITPIGAGVSLTGSKPSPKGSADPVRRLEQPTSG